VSTVHSIVKRKVTLFLQYFVIMYCSVAVVVDTVHSCPGLSDFFAAYGQNPDKKWPKWLCFEEVMAKITKCFN